MDTLKGGQPRSCARSSSASTCSRTAPDGTPSPMKTLVRVALRT
jgi:hypothetical protein